MICRSESAMIQFSSIIYTDAHEAGITQVSATLQKCLWPRDYIDQPVQSWHTYIIFPIKSRREKRWNYVVILFIDLLNFFIWPTTSYSNSSELWNFHVAAKQREPDFQCFLFFSAETAPSFPLHGL